MVEKNIPLPQELNLQQNHIPWKNISINTNGVKRYAAKKSFHATDFGLTKDMHHLHRDDI